MVEVAKIPHDIAIDLAQKYPSSADLNEADTRHQVIDVILHDVLSWPRSAVPCESFIDPGYSDYILLGHHENQILFIEAKKEGSYFTLPAAFDTTQLSTFLRVKTLLTDKPLGLAIEQVRGYCTRSGCEYAAVTNGQQWVFFKTFERQRDWRQLNAFVIRDLHYFSDKFSEATTNFGYVALTEKASLQQLLGAPNIGYREVIYPKSKIVAYNQEVTSNYLAPVLRPFAQRYLGTMDEHDEEFMRQCYVSNREYNVSSIGVGQVIYDCLSPYFVNYNVQEFFDELGGGTFGKRISSSLRERRTREVIVLFGGKGSGKSTFIRRLLYHHPPNPIKHFAIVAVIDLLECPEDRRHIESQILVQFIDKVDQNHLLKGDRNTLLSLFADKFQQAQNQFLVGFERESETYNKELNHLIREWLGDPEYCALRLADYWKKRQKGLIIVLDNTDQFKPENQDYCFTLAQRISTYLDCLVVISMREERFYYSKLHGTLDAFQNSGFHLSSPPPQFVFFRRLNYMLTILDNMEKANKISPQLTAAKSEDIKKILAMLLQEFRSHSSHLSEFLRACAHGNMRLALELFRHFLLSGYTRVDEMIQKGGWKLQVHQVLRPMMVPTRFFYDEDQSSIPNLYRIRSQTTGSHFTALRILSILSKNMSPTNPVYVPLSQLKVYFAGTFNMLDDFEKNLDVLLRRGIVESNNRIDEYADTIDSLKITPFGYYMINTLCYMFNYVDLVSLDCGIHDQAVAHSLIMLAEKDITLFNEYRKMERLQVRLQRVQEFVDYLVKEEEIERDMFSLNNIEANFSHILKERFAEEKKRVLSSAEKTLKKTTGTQVPVEHDWD